MSIILRAAEMRKLGQRLQAKYGVDYEDHMPAAKQELEKTLIGYAAKIMTGVTVADEQGNVFYIDEFAALGEVDTRDGVRCVRFTITNRSDEVEDLTEAQEEAISEATLIISVLEWNTAIYALLRVAL